MDPRPLLHIGPQAALRRLMPNDNLDEDGDEESDHEDDEDSAENLFEFLRTVAVKERKKKKTTYGRFVMYKMRREKVKRINFLQKQRISEKLIPVVLYDCISALFNNPKLSDITLKVGPHHFHAHKLILCAWSEVFRSLTDQRWSSESIGSIEEPQDGTLNETPECQECFEDFLRFMYTEQVDLTEANVYPILTLADKYLVHDLHEVCEEYLLVRLESSTMPFIDAMQALKLTEGLPKVQRKSFSLLESNFHSWPCVDDPFSMEHSCDITKELLVQLLQSSNLVVPNETDIFQSVMRWLFDEKCRVEREEYFEEMLSLFRFEHIPASDLAVLHNSVPVPHRARLKECIFDALKVRALAGEEAYVNMTNEFSEPRLYMEPLFCVRITNSLCHIEGELPFKKISLFTENTDAEFKKFRLLCPVARQSEEQNIYLVNQDMWEVGGLAVKQETGDNWGVRYIVKPHFEDIGRSYRMAILTHQSGNEEEQSIEQPITCIDQGNIGTQITIEVPPALEYDCNPDRLWIQVAIYVYGNDKSWDR